MGFPSERDTPGFKPGPLSWHTNILTNEVQSICVLLNRSALQKTCFYLFSYLHGSPSATQVVTVLHIVKQLPFCCAIKGCQ